ncbi:MAG: hypothetical protein SPJ79_01410 [Prevotella sp.]|nr:hypothetical protein [Bacteroidales bacterium]MDY5876232.1 hypothetical protein [Prevotella sp.]
MHRAIITPTHVWRHEDGEALRMDGIIIRTSATRQKNLTYPSRHDGWHKHPYTSHKAEESRISLHTRWMT